jgi:hypothetical protein
MGVQVSRICTIFYGESVLEIFASFDLDKNVPPTHGRLKREVVAASNTGQADWLVLIATVVPS